LKLQQLSGVINFNEYKKDKWCVFFSHPGDFTPVCTTEFIAFARAYTYFEERNTCLLGLSVDSNSSHLAWIHNIFKNTGIKIPFPIIADRDAAIARKFGMISPEISNIQAVRNVYIIDPNNKIRTILIYPLTTGRCIPEILRIIDALQLTDKENVSTPANWTVGSPVIIPPPNNIECLYDRVNNQADLTCMDWYLCLKQKELIDK